ncbi:hypothetical protein JOD97_001671 [Duganella sp. 1411]|nr:hypothetical protein [Duganella sp. 1411]
MDNLRGLIPIIVCAVIVMLRWRATTDVDTKIYNIRKKHWYAIFEFILLVAALVIILKAQQ